MAHIYETGVGGADAVCQFAVEAHIPSPLDLRIGYRPEIKLAVVWDSKSKESRKTEVHFSPSEALKLIEEIASSLREQGSPEFLAMLEQRSKEVEKK